MSGVAYWFDLDGTLVEYDRPFADLLEDAIGETLPEAVHDTFGREVFVALDTFDEAPFRSAFEAVASAHDLQLDPAEAAATFRERELEATRPMPGAEAALRRAGELGAVGVLTNGDGALQRAKLDDHGLDALVDAVVVSNEVGHRKPEAAIFDVAADRLPADVHVYVGDSYEDDIAPASEAGFVPVHVRHDQGPAVSLASLAPLVSLLGDASEAT